MNWLSRRIHPPARPSEVYLVGRQGERTAVSGRLVYLGWHDGAHTWQLPLSEDEEELVTLERLQLEVGALPLKQGLLVTRAGAELSDVSWD